ncbi:MAG: tagatose 1,6-diphosphate aldolase [Deinococcus-Thermus bacterium]|jgi:tagatose 1,6-diphosphate aldolase|nr:tagatose 1,6-diphosphate aldolase [Deinococcota bacterium]
MTRTVFDALNSHAWEDGVIAAAAMDQRGSLRRALTSAGMREVTDRDLEVFKRRVVEALSPHASSVLLDPSYGRPAADARADGCGLLYAYEKSGYDTRTEGRQPELLPGASVRRLVEGGATGVKLLVYYAPDHDPAVNDVKHAFVERVGAECRRHGVPLFLEPVTYDDEGEPRESARRRPERVRGILEEFSKDRYGVDVLKVEYPVEPKFTRGLAGGDDAVHDLEVARDALLAADEAADRPYIFLSAGVDMDVFETMLSQAGRAGIGFAGVLCGRATWKGGIDAYARGGEDALRRFMDEEGVPNIETLNRSISANAKPWWDAYGGRDAIELDGA